MSARQFRDKLIQIGYPNAKLCQLATFEFLVENKQLAPFFEFFNQIDENNILTEEEIERYEQLKASGTEILELEALESSNSNHQQPMNELEDEISQLAEELASLKHEASMQELLNTRLSRELAVKKQRTSNGWMAAKHAEKAYDNALKECQVTNAELNAVFNDVQEPLSAIDEITKLNQANTSLAPYLAFMPLEGFQKGYSEYNSYLMEYIKKQFPSVIMNIADLGSESSYEMISLKSLPNGAESMPEEKLILYKLLKMNYDKIIKVESQTITAECTESGLKEEIEMGKRLLDSLKKGICPYESILSIKLSENNAELANLKCAAQKVEDTIIPKLVKSLADVNASSVITGNYTLKWERQKYVLAKMDQLISWLVEHQSQAELFSWCLTNEHQIFKQINQFLGALDLMTQEQLDGVQSRMLAMEKLRSSIRDREDVAKDGKEIMGSLDKILRSYNNPNPKSILSKDKLLLVKLKDLTESVATCEAEAEANFNEEITSLKQIHFSLISLEDTIWAECKTKSGLPLIGPKAVCDSVQHFQTKLENLNYEFLAAKLTFEKKEKKLNSNTKLNQLRTCYLDFYNKII